MAAPRSRQPSRPAVVKLMLCSSVRGRPSMRMAHSSKRLAHPSKIDPALSHYYASARVECSPVILCRQPGSSIATPSRAKLFHEEPEAFCGSAGLSPHNKWLRTVSRMITGGGTAQWATLWATASKARPAAVARMAQNPVPRVASPLSAPPGRPGFRWLPAFPAHGRASCGVGGGAIPVSPGRCLPSSEARSMKG